MNLDEANQADRDTIAAAWLASSRKRLSAAALGGNHAAIVCAYQAYLELRLDILLKQGEGARAGDIDRPAADGENDPRRAHGR